jgi:hypothetical protein
VVCSGTYGIQSGDTLDEVPVWLCKGMVGCLLKGTHAHKEGGCTKGDKGFCSIVRISVIIRLRDACQMSQLCWAQKATMEFKYQTRAGHERMWEHDSHQRGDENVQHKRSIPRWDMCDCAD